MTELKVTKLFPVPELTMVQVVIVPTAWTWQGIALKITITKPYQIRDRAHWADQCNSRNSRVDFEAYALFDDFTEIMTKSKHFFSGAVLEIPRRGMITWNIK